MTNAIIHGYENGPGMVEMELAAAGSTLTVTVADKGVGIADIDLARQPFYTSRPELERSGMGFTVMEAFMEDVSVCSAPGQGTRVTMKKTLGAQTCDAHEPAGDAREQA